MGSLPSGNCGNLCCNDNALDFELVVLRTYCIFTYQWFVLLPRGSIMIERERDFLEFAHWPIQEWMFHVWVYFLDRLHHRIGQCANSKLVTDTGSHRRMPTLIYSWYIFSKPPNDGPRSYLWSIARFRFNSRCRQSADLAEFCNFEQHSKKCYGVSD